MDLVLRTDNIVRTILRRILVPVLCLSACLSCVREHEADKHDFTNSEIQNLSINGEVKLLYNPDDWQIAFSAERREFRAFNDRMTKFMRLRCSTIPSHTGQSVDCFLEYADGHKINRLQKASYKVIRMEDDGRIWFWCGRKNTGVMLSIIH